MTAPGAAELSGVRPAVGLIVPPGSGKVPPECITLYGKAIDFRAAGVGLETLELASYRQAERFLPVLARQLVDAGAQSVVLMGTSMSFHAGRAHARALEATMAEAAGAPATSMSSAIVAALRQLGCRRVAVATAYVEEVNNALRAFLDEHEIETQTLQALDIREVDRVHGVGEAELLQLGRAAHEAAPDADALFISCGGLQTLGLTGKLEAEIGKPVVSSAVAGAWAAASQAGIDARRQGFGRFLESFAAMPSAPAANPG